MRATLLTITVLLASCGGGDDTQRTLIEHVEAMSDSFCSWKYDCSEGVEDEGCVRRNINGLCEWFEAMGRSCNEFVGEEEAAAFDECTIDLRNRACDEGLSDACIEALNP